MLTCFLHINYNFNYSTLFNLNIKYFLTILAFLSIPFCIFIYASIQALIIMKYIKSQKDFQTKSFLIKFSLRLVSYILLIILLLIIYLWNIFSTNNNNITDNFKIFSFIVTLSSMFIPIVVGFIQFFLFYVNYENLAKKYNKSKRKYLYTYNNNDSTLLNDLITKAEKGTFERLEEKSKKKVINISSYINLYFYYYSSLRIYLYQYVTV